MCKPASAVCSESISGIVCSVFGFALSMVLEFLFSWWLLALCIEIGLASTRSSFDWVAFLVAGLYLVLPYVLLLAARAYCLTKAQAYRRALKRDEGFRLTHGEQSSLVKKQWGGA